MRKLLMGGETEYALIGCQAGGKPASRQALARSLFESATRLHPHVSGTDNSLFLSNGARFYVDRGAHPEYATPECTDPWQTVQHIRAGDRLVQDLAAVLATDPGLTGVEVLRANVDYANPAATWGCHESYLVRQSPKALARQLTSHLVSRIIYTGAGGFVPGTDGLEFTLSPRAWHFNKVVNSDSTQVRGIFHTRDESLANEPFHRLHVIAGESLCSDRATVLKHGTTALIAAVAELVADRRDAIELMDPVAALHHFAADPTCTTTVPLASGCPITAVALQRRYLAHVVRHLGQLPPWAADLCHLWRRTLDELERQDAAMAKGLDWPLKLALFARHAAGRFDWTDLQRWSRRLRRTPHRPRPRWRAGGPSSRMILAELLRPGGPKEARARRAARRLAYRGHSRATIAKFGAVRAELLEADLRFGQLGPNGVFANLHRGGSLEHSLAESSAIGRALCTPPTDTRAAIRGRVIASLAARGAPDGSWADWSGIRDGATGRFLNLGDPFATGLRWEDDPDEQHPGTHARMLRLLRAARGPLRTRAPRPRTLDEHRPQHRSTRDGE